MICTDKVNTLTAKGIYRFVVWSSPLENKIMKKFSLALELHSLSYSQLGFKNDFPFNRTSPLDSGGWEGASDRAKLPF